MDGWIVWLVVACAFGAGEVLSGSAFYLAPFAIGAGIAAVADVALGDLVSVIVFLAASIGTLTLVRPLVTSRLLTGPQVSMNASALVGKVATVMEPVTEGSADGRVKIDGEIWSARAIDAGAEIPAGAQVHVVKIEGATALVMQ